MQSDGQNGSPAGAQNGGELATGQFHINEGRFSPFVSLTLWEFDMVPRVCTPFKTQTAAVCAVVYSKAFNQSIRFQVDRLSRSKSQMLQQT